MPIPSRVFLTIGFSIVQPGKGVMTAVKKGSEPKFFVNYAVAHFYIGSDALFSEYDFNLNIHT